MNSVCCVGSMCSARPILAPLSQALLRPHAKWGASVHGSAIPTSRSRQAHLICAKALQSESQAEGPKDHPQGWRLVACNAAGLGTALTYSPGCCFQKTLAQPPDLWGLCSPPQRCPTPQPLAKGCCKSHGEVNVTSCEFCFEFYVLVRWHLDD
jgi:hypothetical protein